MAARNQHVLDSAVVERRLRPIYEWLDSGNPKKALQEAEKVLRKTPSLQCAKALKALSLLQLGREAECITILDALALEIPSDNSTLQAMTICYRDLNKLEKVCNLYEKAVQADPSNEELHTHLFMSYVRTSNFQQQQKSAMILFKMKPKNPYYFWAIMSILLQATKGAGAAEPNKRHVLLSLAERMVEKLFNENKLEAGQEIQLYLMILELQGKYEQALNILDGPLGTKLLSGSTDENRINYLTKLSKWNDLNKFCNDLLTANMDRWDIWNHYLTSMFELAKLNATNVNNHNEHNLEGPDDTPEKVHEFICSVIENNGDDNLFKNSASYQLRGPYLARLELCARLKKGGKDPTHLLGDVFELLVEYFRLFGHKPCCVSDLKIYLGLLGPERRIELASRLLKDVEITSVTIPQNEKQMQRHICALQMSRLCGAHAKLDVDLLTGLVQAFALHYENGARNFGTGKLPTDQGPADAYALLAVHTLYDLSLVKNSSAPLISGLVLLESLLKSSPSNFHAKLLCVRLYHLIGAADGAQKMYESLDTKHLQMDSLGFVHSAYLHSTGLFALTASMYDATLKFFSTNYRDSIDHLTFSYKYGSFLKLEEFMEFRNRLNNSLHYTLTAIDRMLLEIITCTNLKCLNIDASSKNNNINWELLRDNNDYNVYMSWDKERINGPLDKSEEIRQLFEENRDFTRLRAGVLCAISGAIDLLKQNDDDEKESNIKSLETSLEQWLEHCRQIETKHKYIEMQPQLSLPIPSRIHSYLKTPFRRILEPIMRLVVTATRRTDANIQDANIQDANIQDANIQDANIEDIHNALTELSNDISRLIDEQNTTEDCLWMRRSTIEYIVNSVELLCVCSVLCAIIYELLKPMQQSTSNKKSKKKTNTAAAIAAAATAGGDNNIIDKIRGNLRIIVAGVRKCCTTIERQLDRWQTVELAQRLGAIAIEIHQQSDKDTVYNYIQTSHATAMKELKVVLLNKCKLLNMID